MLRTVIFAAHVALAASPLAAEITSSVDIAALSDPRKTALGLYLSSSDADAALAGDPGIVLIDVRTQEEFNFVGHPDAVDGNVPFSFVDVSGPPGKNGSYDLLRNPDFLKDAEALLARLGKGRETPILVICRSGSRSAAAVNVLAGAGYTRVYNVVDGFEGDIAKDSGHRTKEGWRYSNLPWSYGIRPDQAYRPAQ
jgi:rhodanese-related sulfurtransferase